MRITTTVAALLTLFALSRQLPCAVATDVLAPAAERFSGSAESREVPDFQRHVIPLLGRQGCNGRACHGSFQGRGGMALSLFGYDFGMDHAAISGRSQSQPGRRINPDSAERSLILLKATDEIGHQGGQRFANDSWQYNLLHRWISAGAPGNRGNQSLSSLHVEPRQLTWSDIGGRTQLKVIAHWSDGSREDVTCLSRFRSNDDAVVAVESQGWTTALDRGDTHVIAFYDNAVAAIPATIAKPPTQAVPWPDDPPPTPVDRFINDKLRSLGLVPAAVCDDAEFIRRLSVDLTGTLPPPGEVEVFLAEGSADKRQRKIDQLLKRPAMAAWWANKLCDFTGCNPQQQAELGQELAQQWYMWIYQRLRDNTPYDQIVERIMLATGRSGEESYAAYAATNSAYFHDEDPADFSLRQTMPHYWSRRALEKPADKALAVAHSFLGIRLQCAQCHKHPWDQWTRQDFEQFSQFFADVKFGVADDARGTYRELAKQVGLRLRSGQDSAPIRAEQLARVRRGETVPWREVYVEPRSQAINLNLLRHKQVMLDTDEDPRVPVMQWMRDPQNPWFARAIVNRVWASCFHVGIVDPPDDLNAASPPSNPELLDWLAKEFVRQGYDLRWLLKEITRSATWQRSCRPNATNANDRRNFSRAIPRRLPAEILYDGIKQVLCGSDEQQTVREDLSRRAVGHLSMRMAGTYAMHVFGKPERAVTCDCERTNEPSLLQSVFLQNDPLIHLLLDDSGWLAEIRGQANPDEPMMRGWVREAWLRAYSRPPREEEAHLAMKHLLATESPAAGMEDLLWSLLNTKEFLLNH